VDEPEGFRAFVAARSPALLRSAWYLTGNEASAEDLVQTALAKTWTKWSRIVRQDAPEAYVRRVIVSTYLTWNRRRWHGEQPTAILPDAPDPTDAYAVLDVQNSVLAALAALPPRQRTVVILRYFDDLTEAQAADVMGCSIGTVKSQTAKAFATLRGYPQLRGLTTDGEVSHEQG
jgi:RNA polymerase sigma-70 factor (sigma-E family)